MKTSELKDFTRTYKNLDILIEALTASEDIELEVVEISGDGYTFYQA